MGETYRRTNITAILHQSGLDGKVTKLKLLLSKDTRNHDWNLQKYTQITLRLWKKNILWSDESQFLIHVWGKPSTAYHLHNTIPTVKHGGGCIMPWGCFLAAGTGEVIREDWKLIVAKYRYILNENLVQSAQNLRLGWKFTFQHDNHPTRTAKTMQEGLRDDSMNVLEWPSQSWDLEPIRYLWRNL